MIVLSGEMCNLKGLPKIPWGTYGALNDKKRQFSTTMDNTKDFVSF